MGELKSKVISPTAINMYTRCGEMYRRRYVEKDIIPPGIALAKGSSVHSGAEYNFKQKIETKADLPKSQIIDFSVAALETNIGKNGLLLSEEEEAAGKTKTIGKAKDSVTVLASLYSEKIAPVHQPVEVETKSSIDIAQSGITLLGKIDLVNDKDTIVDLKTGSKTANQADVDKSIQLTFYGLLYKAKHRKDPAGFSIEQMIDKKHPDTATFHTQRFKEDYSALVNRINTVINGIDKGNFPPAPEGAWWCSPRFCGYWRTCPYINSNRIAVKEEIVL